MLSCVNSTSSNIFQEAINHCRWKKTLFTVLDKLDIKEFENKSFEEIIIIIFNLCIDLDGLGMLVIYDITSGICKYYGKNIDKVFIVGKGPKRAIKLLNIKKKLYKINDRIKIHYVDIDDIIEAFDKNGYELTENIRNTKITRNGDMVESFICVWQKTKK